jgi:hypothetical protein
MNKHYEPKGIHKLGLYCLVFVISGVAVSMVGAIFDDIVILMAGLLIAMVYMGFCIIFYIQYQSIRTRLMIADMLKKDYYPKYCPCDYCEEIKKDD